jgi:STE24 endopeptidase
MEAFNWMLLFAAAVSTVLLAKLWLATRQVRHVAQHSHAVPAAFADVMPLEAHRKAAQYTVARTRFGLLSTAFSTALLLAWTLLGGLDTLNGLVRELVLPWGGALAYQVALVAAFLLIGSLLELPFDLWTTFRIEERFGFNRMTPALFVSDLLKGLLVSALLGLPLLALVLWLMGSAGRWWWLWAWGAWSGFQLLMLLVYPSFIAPLFNKFRPLEDEGLRQRVMALMQRCGFAAKGLFVMDGSRRSAHGNAYFTGLGAAKRVVFFDTLLSKLQAGEVEAVLAHELGHFKLRHVGKRMALMLALSLAGFALLGWCSTQPWFYAGLGVRANLDAPNDALALLLFMMVVPTFGFFVAPWMARLSRRHEFEADAFACREADGRALASALLKLHEDNASTLTPDPLYARVYYSHPPATERLAALDRHAPALPQAAAAQA